MMQSLTRLCHLAFFGSVSPLIRLGRERPLQAEDLPALPAWLEPQATPTRFLTISLGGPRRFLLELLLACRGRLAAALGLTTALMATAILLPVTIHALVEELGDVATGGGSVQRGVVLTLGFCALMLANTVVGQHYLYTIITLNQRLLSALNIRIYGHTLTLSRRARQAKPIGDVVNHIGTDAGSVAEIAVVVPELVYGVGIILLVTLVACRYIGWAALVALAVLGVLSPLCRVVASRFVKYDDEITAYRDQRVSLMSQIIAGIRVVKYLAWEKRLAGEVAVIRNEETRARRQLAAATSSSMLFFLGAQALATSTALGAYVCSGHRLNAATAFAVIALFDLWQHPFAHLTQYIADLAAAKVGADRILTFLREERVEKETATVNSQISPGLCLAAFTATHGADGEPAVKDWCLSLAAGSATAIVGPVGGGKSSLLLALLGELQQVGGTRRWVGLGDGERPRMAWVAQSPYIINGTIEENIGFGAPVDLSAALRLSAMTLDVATMPAGIHTEIGEQGLNLSGGQKQRLSLARAIALSPTVALLDDPFSAVDRQTESFLVDELLFGEWSRVTRIVATHRLEHLAKFDQIIFVVDGEIKATGALPDLLQWCPEFGKFHAEHALLHEMGMTFEQTSSLTVAPVDLCDKPSGHAKITAAEDREQGHVRLRVYVDYLWALGGSRTATRRILGLSALAMATLIVGLVPMVQNYWLSLWTASAPKGGRWWLTLASLRGSELRNVAVFSLLAVLGVVGAFGRHWFWGQRAVGASCHLHDRALHGVLGTKVRFFDANPVGRILNRFAVDLDAIERQMATSFEQTVIAFVHAAVTISLILALTPWTLLVLVPAMAVFFRLQDTYRRSGRETKRLDSLARSPRFAHFKETLEGLDTIRAHDQQPVFWRKFQRALAENQRCFRGMVMVNRWFSVRLPLLTAAVALVSIAAVLLAARHHVVGPATGALLVFYNFIFTDHLNWAVRSFSEAESRLTSVERLKAYGDLPPEPDVLKQPSSIDDTNWPNLGALEFINVWARYAPELAPVLRGISLKIPAGAKVGVIGRTGAGKSSLIQVLFRFIELDGGTVTIDGCDIASVAKARLRRALAIIPQNPILFLGTLRANLDRFNVHTDEKIWSALAQVQLTAFVKALPNGLNNQVLEGGANFSEGQKQLFCLARALLSDAKIIVMDEATANVDAATDGMIHQAMQAAFGGRTMLIIAHRLGTISHCDMVVEMDHGGIRSLRYQAPEAPSLVAASAGGDISLPYSSKCDRFAVGAVNDSICLGT